MESTPITTNTSPFESGDWGRWTNLERCNWLRAFYEGLKSNEEHIAKGFKLDKKKMKRLGFAEVDQHQVRTGSDSDWLSLSTPPNPAR